MEMIKQSVDYVVEHVGSPGFFLQMDRTFDAPSFTAYIQYASTYSSLELANILIVRMRKNGWTMELVPRQLRTTYEIGEVYHETE